MVSERLQQPGRWAAFSPWIIIGAVLILAGVLFVLAVRNVSREREFMERTLLSEANVLLWSVEAGSRTGMMGMGWGQRQIQTLLEETARQPDVKYVALLDSKGRVANHSDPAQVGQAWTGVLPKGGETVFRFVEVDDKIFEVGRAFRPWAARQRGWGRGGSAGAGDVPNEGWCGPGFSPTSTNLREEKRGGHGVPSRGQGMGSTSCPLVAEGFEGDYTIIVGLDTGGFEEALKQDFQQTVVIFGVMFLVGAAGFLSLFWAQYYRSARRSLLDMEEQLRRSQRLAALGRLAAGVAHEIRNPLSSIKGFATILAGRFAEDDSGRNLAHVMAQEVERLNRVVTELLDFARPTELHRRRTTWRELIEHSLHLVEQDAAEQKVEVSWRVVPEDLAADVDTDRLAQVLLNLYLNALQAMESGGKLRISVRVGAGGEHVVTVTDTGAGIAPEQLPHIFDPYFTTKPRGVGLGLANVHKVMDAHGGSIEVTSVRGRGTTFTLSVPVG